VDRCGAGTAQRGYEDIPVPNKLPREAEFEAAEYQFINFSDGANAGDGAWANGPTPDGRGEFSYLEKPDAGVPAPPPTRPDARYYGTTDIPNPVEKTAAKVQDKLHKE
jgi:Mn-containing catalase